MSVSLLDSDNTKFPTEAHNLSGALLRSPGLPTRSPFNMHRSYPCQKTNSIDIGLAVLSVVNLNADGDARIPLTLADIAFVCGCSRERIRQIEARAIKKIRLRLNAESPEHWQSLANWVHSGGRSLTYAVPFRGHKPNNPGHNS